MQVKKFEASTIIEALHEVKGTLGPDAIILSTQEVKSSLGGSKFVIVAAVSDQQLKKKEIAEKKLGDIFSQKVSQKTAHQQKAVIESVYKNLERKAEKKNRVITQTRYIDIDESGQEEAPVMAASLPKEQEDIKGSSATRVKNAAQEAFKSSLNSEFFSPKKKEPRIVENVLPQRSESFVVSEPKQQFSQPIAVMMQKLKECGVNQDIIQSLAGRAQVETGLNRNRRALIDAWFAKWILNNTKVAEPVAERAVEIFVGPHGAGKTTTLLKLATNYVVQQRKSVAIITSDVNRVGAVEHLRVFSRILNVPVFIATSVEDLQNKIYQLEEYDSVLIDTPGISLGNMAELDFMKALSELNAHKEKRTHLTISALTKGSDLGSILKRFRVSGFDDVVITNIDQTTQHGILINMQEKMDVPFHSFGIGSDIVDGFEYASRERVLDLIFKLTKINGDRAHGDSI